MFKSQLHEFAQKSGWAAPVYGVVQEGPQHDPCFTATVNINGKIFASRGIFHHAKKAKHGAAEVALEALTAASKSDLKASVPLHEAGLCKNMLQEYAQKNKLAHPVYHIVKSGEEHAPVFRATVEFCQVMYSGGACKRKIGAEIKAAKTAWVAISSESGGSAMKRLLASRTTESPRAPSEDKQERKKLKLSDEGRKVDEGVDSGKESATEDGQVESSKESAIEEDTQETCGDAEWAAVMDDW